MGERARACRGDNSHPAAPPGQMRLCLPQCSCTETPAWGPPGRHQPRCQRSGRAVSLSEASEGTGAGQGSPGPRWALSVPRQEVTIFAPPPRPPICGKTLFHDTERVGWPVEGVRHTRSVRLSGPQLALGPHRPLTA